MANVTDWAFRKIIAKCGKPDVFYTEFLSCDGILHDKTKFEKELYFEKSEKPIVVQFFGSKPENFYKCAQLAVELGFDGIDINMGCPDRSVEKQGAGASLIKNPKLAQEIVRETKRGARSTRSSTEAHSKSSGQADIPISIKTRLGYNKIETREWVSTLLEMNPAVLIIHGRTRKEISSVPAHWDEIGIAAEIAKNTETLIVGNGDVIDLNDARQKAKEYNLDGIMVGRGVFADPWFFREDAEHAERTPKERIDLLTEHLDNFEKLWGSNGRFDTMKKFFKVYISGWEGAKELRAKLMIAKNTQEVVDILAKTT
ncbi:MAG: tRNA-dihydrouridine synthase family protein [Candidatus Yanofskybacteria bacterium]|nr:tRNA-dihydrouridine synthase family protein [Candidatus Yanofskybacteria bacterium]